MVEVRSLRRSFGGVRAVDDVSFEVRAGEIFGLLGPNGAGKTTTIKMLLGLLKPDSGAILFQGNEIQPAENMEFRGRIGYVPENCMVYETLTAREYLSFVGELHHLDPTLTEERAARLLEIVQLSAQTNQPIRDYSKGMRQKILIVSAVLPDPDIVILDEPFSGLDANTVLLFKEFFREAANRGKAVIFCSHILEVVERLVDRMVILDHGKPRAAGTPTEILAQTGHTSLERAFNALTGTGDVAVQARDMLDAVESGRRKEQHDGR